MTPLERLAQQMAAAVDAEAITPAAARSIIGQAAFDAVGRSDVITSFTRRRNHKSLLTAMEGVRGEHPRRRP